MIPHDVIITDPKKLQEVIYLKINTTTTESQGIIGMYICTRRLHVVDSLADVDSGSKNRIIILNEEI